MSLYNDLLNATNAVAPLPVAGSENERDNLCRSQIFFADSIISSAAMDTLAATPVTLVGAPGSGKVLVFRGAYVYNKYASPAFAVLGTIDISYTDNAGNLCGVIPRSFIISGSAVYGYVAPNAFMGLTANAALVLSALDDVTAGGGSLYMRVFYQIVNAGDLL